MTRSEAEAEVRSIERRCRGPLHPDSAKVRDALLADGQHEEAAHEDAAGRPGCGSDFNDVVCAGEFDGKPHEYTCPSCGVAGVYTAPIYELEG